MTTTQTRDMLAIALDVPTLDEAERLATAVAPHFGVAKVGLQLFSEHGPEAVERIRATGLRVFLDVKLHDIPNTVAGAARALGKLGAAMVTVHADGRPTMIRAAVEGLAEGAEEGGHQPPIVLAVTVLTSIDDAPADELTRRAGWAVEGGAGGIVCAVPDLPTVKAAAPDLLAVTPGIRLPDGDHQDQQRVATPWAAVEAGAGLLVIGRAVTKADDPAQQAAEIASRLAA